MGVLGLAVVLQMLGSAAQARYVVCGPDAPAQLCHDEGDTPTPTWEQLTGGRGDVVGHVARILGDGDAGKARERYGNWPGPIQRGFALLIAKIHNEGWLDCVGALKETPTQDGIVFTPARGPLGQIEDALGLKSWYRENSLWNGVIAYLGAWNHKNWRRAWSDTTHRHSSLHVGITYDGIGQAHFEIYNPFFRGGDAGLIALHQKWEANYDLALISRRSANHYHFLAGQGLPLAF